MRGAAVRAQVLAAFWLAASSPAYGAADAWLTVSVNGVSDGEPRLVHESDEPAFYLRESAVQGLALPPAAIAGTVDLRGERHVRLVERPGVHLQRNEADASLEVTVAPWLYASQTLGSENKQRRIDVGEPALFANYDVLAVGGDLTARAGQFEVGMSRGRLSLVTSSLASDNRETGVARLETSLRADFPERRMTLGLGDMITSAVASSRALRFGGLQWATDFGTQPAFVPYAMPTAQGVAVLPSMVDLYVNGAVVSRREVAAGPFSITDLPVPAGTGMIELRVRDALGRVQIITQPFLVTPLLFKPGLSAYSFEVGAVREDYGLSSFRYGEPFAAFAFKRGATEALTWQAGAEVLRTQSTVRAAAITKLGGRLVLQAGGAASREDGRIGKSTTLAFGVSGRVLDFGAQWQGADAHFTELSALDPQSRYKQTLSGQVSMRLASSMSVALVHAYRKPVVGPRGYVTTASYSLSRLFDGSLSAYASRAVFDARDTTIGITFSRATGMRSTSSGVVSDSSGTGFDLRAARSATRETNWGWDLSARAGGYESAAARVERLTSFGTGDVQTNVFQGRATASAGWRGGWLWTSGANSFTPPLYGAIGVIEVPGTADVTVFHGGENLGRTDSRGRLVATTLRAYQNNDLFIDAGELPLGAWIEKTEMVVRPYARNVVRVRFPVEAETATLRLRTTEGQVLPSGALATVGDVEAPVGDDGLTVVPVGEPGDAIEVRWDDTVCRARLAQEQWNQAKTSGLTVACKQEPAQ